MFKSKVLSIKNGLYYVYRAMTTIGRFYMGFAHTHSPVSYVRESSYCNCYQITKSSLSYLSLTYAIRRQLRLDMVEMASLL